MSATRESWSPCLKGCPVCGGDRKILYFGSGPNAEVRACSWCDDGRKLADSDHPVAFRTT